MEYALWFLVALLVFVGIPLFVLRLLFRLHSRLAAVERQLERLGSREPERASQARPVGPIAAEDDSIVRQGTPAVDADAPTPKPPGAPTSAPKSRPLSRPDAASKTPARPLDVVGVEQLVGGVWLQNAGALLLLAGLFLMALWGYTSGRIGPGMLVVAGVALGLTVVWRGDRLAKRIPSLGHALIGVGIGVVYLTLYVGLVRLQAIGPHVALPLLALTSLASIGAGLSYRVQSIAMMGVLGAFLPQLLATWLGMGGFGPSPWTLLAYFAVVNVVVFTLSARVGWNALNLVALALTAMAWGAAFPGGSWGWGHQVAMSALLTGLGLAPLPRSISVEGRVRPSELAVIAVAPLALLIASSPFLVEATRASTVLLLTSVATVQFAAAWWSDVRRPERDLWVPLTAAGTLCATVAIARAVGSHYMSVAWCVEGIVLLALGIRPRAGWLRVWGSLVLASGGFLAMAQLVESSSNRAASPVQWMDALLSLGETTALLLGAVILARGRSQLTLSERFTPEIWTAFGSLLLTFWIGVHAEALAARIMSQGPVLRREALEWALCSVGWMSQAGALVWLGSRSTRPFLRCCGHAVGGLAFLSTLLRRDLGTHVWTRESPLILDPVAMLGLGVIAVALLVAQRLATHRPPLDSIERRASEVWCVAGLLALMSWLSVESTQMARSVVGPALSITAPRRLDAITAACTSGTWLMTAASLLASGWLRGSAFLRWCGLVLVGVTLLKFIAIDLHSVDVFWRFLTAILAGAALLGMSYAYQRREIKRSGAAAADPAAD